MLISKLRQVRLKEATMQSSTQLHSQLAALMEKWEEGEHDPLSYVAPLASPRLRKIFPNFIQDNIDKDVRLPDSLPTDTDKELWRYAIEGKADEGVVETLRRLDLLEQTQIYSGLPAEVLVELAHALYRVKLLPNERIIAEGEKNDDIYVLIQGELTVSVSQDGRSKFITTLKPGDVFGEMAFFTDEARGATVRATETSECFALKASDLYIIAYKHPVVLMQLARTLARRLSRMNQEVGVVKPAYFDSTATIPLSEVRQ
jgi:CRP-like cAMP-binding protein